MFVVADQRPLRDIAQCGLAGGTQSEEECHVIRVLAVVRAAVHRQHPLLGKPIVHGGEDAFLDLAGILRARDQDEPLAKMDQDSGLACCAIDLGIGMKTGHVDHGKLGYVFTKFVRVKLTDEHVSGEETMPGVIGDDSHGHAVFRIGTRVSIEHEDVTVLNVGKHPTVDPVEAIFVHWPVDLAPPDIFFAGGFLHNEFIHGRAASVVAGADDDGTEVRECAFMSADDALVKHGRGQVPVNCPGIADAVVIQSVFADVGAKVLSHISLRGQSSVQLYLQ